MRTWRHGALRQNWVITRLINYKELQDARYRNSVNFSCLPFRDTLNSIFYIVTRFRWLLCRRPSNNIYGGRNTSCPSKQYSKDIASHAYLWSKFSWNLCKDSEMASSENLAQSHFINVPMLVNIATLHNYLGHFPSNRKNHQSRY